MTDVDPFGEWDSAYVLGMLGPADRREFEEHLTGCGACTAAVAELAGMPGLLSVLSREEALALDDGLPQPRPQPVSLPDPGYDRPAHSDRSGRVRRIVLAAAMVALLVGGGIAVGHWALPSSTAVGSPSDSTVAGQEPTIAMTPVRPGTMTADLRVISRAWGTRLEWTCDYLDTSWAADGPSPVYLLVITDLTGTETPVATWSATGHAAGGLVASTSVPTAQIRSVDIRTVADAAPLVLAHLQPA